MLVGVGNAALVLFLELILRQIGVAAAPQPELFDELLALFVGIQLKESVALIRRDDIGDVLAKPLPVGAVQLLEGPLHLLFRVFGQLLWCWSSRRIWSLLSENRWKRNEN